MFCIQLSESCSQLDLGVFLEGVRLKKKNCVPTQRIVFFNMGVLIKVVRIAIAIFGFLVVDILSSVIFSVWYVQRKQKVPPIKNPLLLQSATQLAKKIRNRKIKCRDVVDAYIERILEVNELINAVIAPRFIEAQQEADIIDAILDSDDIDGRYSEENAPLLGVPFTAKEAFAVKGLTNCSELCMWWESSNNVYGTTRNAYDSSRIVGGSSGGEGCILSAAGSVIGVGSDIGGSIRMPAFFNGIFGHKPTTGIVNCDGQFPNAEAEEKEFLVTGPMCRFASDLIPMFKVMAGAGVKKLKLDTKIDIKKLKMYSMDDDGGSMVVSKMDPELRQAHQRTVDYFETELKIPVERIQLKKFKLSFQLWSAKMATSGSSSFASLMGGGLEINALWELLKWTVRCSDHTLPAIALALGEKLANISPGENDKLVNLCDTFKNEMETLLEENAVLLYPSHPKVAPYHNQPLIMPFNFAYTGIFNVLGLPVTQCPLGLSTAGLPMGLQVISGKCNDHLTIAVAQEIEKAFGGWVPPGTIN